MALIQPPAVYHRQPGAIHLVQGMPQGAGGAFQDAGVGQVKVIAIGFQQLSSCFCLLYTGVGEVDVGPAGKAVFKVPGRFAVADEHKLVHGINSKRAEEKAVGTMLAGSTSG